LFCLARPDVLPADDLAFLVAAQRVKGLAERPTPKPFRTLAEPWRPRRSVCGSIALALLPAGDARRGCRPSARLPVSPMAELALTC